MRTLRGGAHFQNQNAGFRFARFDGSAGGSGNFVTDGNFDFELSGFSLHYGNVRECCDSNFSFADGDECFHVGKKADFFRHHGGGFPSGPPDIACTPGTSVASMEVWPLVEDLAVTKPGLMRTLV